MKRIMKYPNKEQKTFITYDVKCNSFTSAMDFRITKRVYQNIWE